MSTDLSHDISKLVAVCSAPWRPQRLSRQVAVYSHKQYNSGRQVSMGRTTTHLLSLSTPPPAPAASSLRVAPPAAATAPYMRAESPPLKIRKG